MARRKRYYSSNPYRMRRRYTSQPSWDSELVVLIMKLGIVSSLVALVIFVIFTLAVVAMIVIGVAAVVGLFIFSVKHFGWRVTLMASGALVVALLILVSIPMLFDFLTPSAIGDSVLPTLAPTVAPLDVP